MNKEQKLINNTGNKASEKFKKLKNLFPDSVFETVDKNGITHRTIHFQKIAHQLDAQAFHKEENKKEHYSFTWPGKQKAICLANSSATAALEAAPSESMNYEQAKNLYLEGDNLEILKLLCKNWKNKIKMIYIDPPYNTGNEYIFNDKFSENRQQYLQRTSKTNSDLSTQPFANDMDGRFHAKWLNMMYPRLKIAKDLLSDDGVMFISIDDNELANLLKISAELFGEKNVSTMIWQKVGYGDAGAGRMKATKRFRCEHETIVAIYKDQKKVSFHRQFEKPNFLHSYGNPDKDPRGPYKAGNISKTEAKSLPHGKNYYTVISPSKKIFTRQWHFDKTEFERLDKDKRIYWGKNGNSVPALKIFINEKRQIVQGSLLLNIGSATSASKDLRKLFNAPKKIFDNPKPVQLIIKLLQLATNPDDVILDFFSGSATTAHAVIELNSNDEGNRKFIMVQAPELTAKTSNAHKAGFKTICDIGKQRIRLAYESISKKFLDKHSSSAFNQGFRVYKLVPKHSHKKANLTSTA